MAIWFNSVNCFDLSECRPRVDNVTVIFVKKKKNKKSPPSSTLLQDHVNQESVALYWTGLKTDKNGIVEPGYNSGAMQSLDEGGGWFR